jgi:hypothetical protein
MFLLVFLLAVKVQYVSCPGDTWHRTATLASHLDTSAPAPQPDRSDIWYVSKTLTTSNMTKFGSNMSF